MSVDNRTQARVLAEYGSGLPRHILDALAGLGPVLRPALEPLPPAIDRDVLDALLGLLAGEALTLEQRRELAAPLAGQLAALTADAGADAGRGHLSLVAGEG